MNIFQEYGKEIVSVLVPFITWFLNVGIRGKVKLVWAARHAFTFLVQEPLLNENQEVVRRSQTVCTASIRVINAGRQPATKVELVFNFKAPYLNFWPVCNYTEKMLEDGRQVLTFENLSPKEEIGIEIMSINNDLPAVIQLRSAECVGKQIAITWIEQFAAWKIRLARVLMFIGFATSVYGLIVLIQLLVLKTPSVA